MKKLLFFTLLLMSKMIFAQTTTPIVDSLITGIVRDDSGMPLEYVLIDSEKGETTETDAQGFFKIKATVGEKLTFFCIGMEEVSKPATKEPMQIVLLYQKSGNETKSYSLQEVVVLTSGSGKKRNITSKQTDRLDEKYLSREENIFHKAQTTPLSTFSLDVNKSSYPNIRRAVREGDELKKEAVKLEEIINYFDYEYPKPQDKALEIYSEYAQCPWNKEHNLVKIGIQAKETPAIKLPPSSLTFLVDVSGSMDSEDKLPLLQQSLKFLVEKLRPQDQVAIVVYAGAAGEILPATSINEKDKIIQAIDNMKAGGSTAGGEGIELAYQIAEDNFIEKGNNRIILATDGDFNVGINNVNDLEDLIEQEADESEIFLTCLGFGMGNYRDDLLETLAKNGNGNHAYIDSFEEAQKVFGKDLLGNLFTVAKDVKLQVEFNPNLVNEYRLIGYENNQLDNEDFKNDKKDAGEIGNGFTVTALYEIIPNQSQDTISELKYMTPNSQYKNELMTVKLRYKDLGNRKSKEWVHTIAPKIIENPSQNFYFAAAAASYGMLLQHSDFIKGFTPDDLKELLKKGMPKKTDIYKNEFSEIVNETDFDDTIEE